MATTQNFYKIKHGLEVPSQDKIQVTTNTGPTIRPSLLLDFANSKQLDPRINFTRASTGTYYDGKTVAKAEENLLLYSQEFDNAAWGGTATANSALAPDNTTTADIISSNIQSVTVSSNTILTASIFLKKDNNDWFRFTFRDETFNSGFRVWCNLNTGTIGTTGVIGDGTYISSNIISIGNGWHRIFLIGSMPKTAGVFELRSVDSDNGGTITGSAYAWGAQLEQRDTVTAYTPTTDQPITNYIPVLQTASANTARFDHDPVTGESLGLLVEEQRTNLFLRSEEFDNVSWLKTRSSIISNITIAPNGTLTGDKLFEDTNNSTHFVNQSVSFSSGAVLTISLYVKKAERTYCNVLMETGGFVNIFEATFNLSNGSIAFTGGASGGTFLDASIDDVGNGWYKVSVTGIAGTATSGLPRVQIANSSGNTIYAGDGYSGIYIWGAQLEAGAFPTSYIKTEASQVTRSADAASITGDNFSEWYRQDEGTLYGEARSNAVTVTSANRFIMSIDDGSVTNLIGLNTVNIANGTSSLLVRQNDSNTAYVISANQLISDGQKLIGTYKFNDFQFANSGIIGTQDTSGIIPIVDRLVIGNFSGGTGVSILNGTIKKLAYFPARLPNETLQALTSSS